MARLANATLQQRLTALRLYYDYLKEEGIRVDNPVGRGRFIVGKGFGGYLNRGLIPRYRKLPRIPTDQEWHLILQSARGEPIRNRAMMAFACDAGLRREELCALATGDIDPACRRIRVRAETTKNRQERVVPYSPGTEALDHAYLHHRGTISRAHLCTHSRGCCNGCQSCSAVRWALASPRPKAARSKAWLTGTRVARRPPAAGHGV